MDGPPSYATPAAFLEALARRLHTIPERVPHQRALEELLRRMEASVAAGDQPPAPFLQVALRLFYEHNRLRSKPRTVICSRPSIDYARRIRAGPKPRSGRAWTG
jgi:hypothetical protein